MTMQSTEQPEQPLEELEGPETNPILAEIAAMDAAELPGGEVAEEQGTTESAAAEETPSVALEEGAGLLGAAPAQTPIAPQPGLNERDRVRLQQLEQQNSEFVVAQQRAQEAEGLRQYQESLEEQGFTTEQASLVATHINAERQKRVQVEQTALQTEQFRQGQMNAAVYFGQQYGVPAAQLISFQSPEAMESHAKVMKDNNEWKTRVERLEKAQVPAGQPFENGLSSTGVSQDDSFWQNRYNMGDRSQRAQDSAARAAGLK
jgi:hypothetical protein